MVPVANARVARKPRLTPAGVNGMRHCNVIGLYSHAFQFVRACVQGDQIYERAEHERVVQLGEMAFRSGFIDGPAWERGMQAVSELHRLACATASPTAAVATGVFRDAWNGRAFLDEVREKLGLRIELLSERAEAELVFRGARLGASELERAVVIDIGSGSINVAAGDAADLQIARSFPYGVHRLAGLLGDARMLCSASARAIGRCVRDALAPTVRESRRLRPEQIVLTGAAARRLAKLCGNPGGGCEIDRIQLAALIRWLGGRSPAMLVEDGMPAGEAETIAAGAVMVATVLDLCDVTRATVSKGGLSEGVLVRDAVTDAGLSRL